MFYLVTKCSCYSVFYSFFFYSRCLEFLKLIYLKFIISFDYFIIIIIIIIIINRHQTGQVWGRSQISSMPCARDRVCLTSLHSVSRLLWAVCLCWLACQSTGDRACVVCCSLAMPLVWRPENVLGDRVVLISSERMTDEA